jgi:hypothetical protein
MDLSGSQPTAIFEAASSCSTLFAQCLSKSKLGQKERVQDLRSRFDLWAAYTGAFAPAKTSLDDRLLFNQDVKLQVLKLLQMVQRNTQIGVLSSPST